MNPISRAKLNHVFSKHAVDFGITGRWNPTNATLLESAIFNHVANPAVITILGTYRGAMTVTHFYDPVTDLNVMVDDSNDLVSAWKLGANQVTTLLTTGDVR